MGVDKLVEMLQVKFNESAGPWKWSIAVIICCVILCFVGYYVYKWMIFTVEQEDLATRRTFGKIAMTFKSRAHKELYRELRKTHWASDPAFLEAVGDVKLYEPGRHWRLFGMHSFKPTNSQPQNYECEQYVIQGKYEAFWIKITVSVGMMNIVRWQLANSNMDQVVAAIIEDGFAKVQENCSHKMFVKAESDVVFNALNDFISDELAEKGVYLTKVYLTARRQVTEAMLPQVIHRKSFVEDLNEIVPLFKKVVDALANEQAVA